LHPEEQVTKAAADCQGKCNSPINGARQLRSSRSSQVGENHGHEKKRLEALAKYDYERLQHEKPLLDSLRVVEHPECVDSIAKLKIVFNFNLGGQPPSPVFHLKSAIIEV